MTRFIGELLTPSPADEGPADFAAYALGHAVIGAAICEVAGVWAWLFVLVYGVIKEFRDVKLGGSIWDSLTDIGFVCLGVAVCHHDYRAAIFIFVAVAVTVVREAFLEE